jgi:hypothetical protein
MFVRHSRRLAVDLSQILLLHRVLVGSRHNFKFRLRFFSDKRGTKFASPEKHRIDWRSYDTRHAEFGTTRKGSRGFSLNSGVMYLVLTQRNSSGGYCYSGTRCRGLTSWCFSCKMIRREDAALYGSMNIYDLWEYARFRIGRCDLTIKHPAQTPLPHISGQVALDLSRN